MPRGDELVQKLRSLLGLSSYEARAYLALLRLGEAKAPEVAREAGIPVQRIYDVLRRLVHQGLASEEEGRYRPVDPEAALRGIAEERLARAAEEAEELRRLGGLLAREARGYTREYVRVVYGAAAAVAAAASAVEACREPPVFVAYKAVERLEELWPLLSRLLDLLPRGSRVIVPPGSLSRIPPGRLGEARARGVEVVEAEAAFLDMMVACDTVVIGLPSSSHDVVAVVVSNKTFAEALRRRLSSI